MTDGPNSGLRFLLPVLIVLAVSAGAVIFGVVRTQWDMALAGQGQIALAAAEGLAADSDVGLLLADAASLTEAATRAVQADPRLLYAGIWDGDGALLGSEGLGADLAERLASETNDGVLRAGDHFAASRTVRDARGTRLGRAVTIVDAEEALSGLRTSTFRLTALVLVAYGAVGIVVARLILALRSLARGLEERVEERTAALAKAQGEAMRASNAKSQFLASMSHEIRAPMQGILETAGVIRNTQLCPNMAHLANMIHQNGQALLEIVNDIGDFSSIESNQLSVDVQPSDLRALSEDVAAMLAPGAAPNGVEVQHTLGEGTPTWVMADPERLRQVLLNVVNYSLSGSHSGTVVRITVSREARRPGFASIRVRDTGVGVPLDQVGSILRPFARNSTPGDMQRGSGLGLSIAQHLIELMDGTIEVDSQFGRGTEFYIELPAAEGVPSPPKPSVAGPVWVVSKPGFQQEDLRRFLTSQHIDHRFADPEETVFFDDCACVVLVDLEDDEASRILDHFEPIGTPIISAVRSNRVRPTRDDGSSVRYLPLPLRAGALLDAMRTRPAAEAATT